MNALKVHDLIGPIRPGAVSSEVPAQQQAIDSCMAWMPYAVVRRQGVVGRRVAVGVRGLEREERYAGWLDCDEVQRVHLPALQRLRPHSIEMPALLALEEVKARWKWLQLPWGPVGSVGFALATGVAATRAESDLDIAVWAEERLPRPWLQRMLQDTSGLGRRVDVLMETPHGGVTLCELAGGGTRLMLRTATGPRLVDDPWNAPAAPRTVEALV
jgi:phosphoribosyl-dephospho-CoA transferase